MVFLKRITTEYVETEDRIKISGEIEAQQTIVLWLTQRLLINVVSYLVDLIEKDSSSSAAGTHDAITDNDLVQGFAQQAAQAELMPEQAVQTSTGVDQWLILEVDITQSPEGAVLFVFKRKRGIAAHQDKEGRVTLVVESTKLRQWLSIIHAQWRLAGWPLTLWPSWIVKVAQNDAERPLH